MEPSPWGSYRAALHTGWWIRIFYLNRTVFPVRGRNRLVQSVSWSSPSSSESDPNSAWSTNFCVLALGFSFCNSFRSCSKSFESISFKYLFTSTSSGSSLFSGLSAFSANFPSLPDSSMGSPDSKSINCNALGTSSGSYRAIVVRSSAKRSENLFTKMSLTSLGRSLNNGFPPLYFFKSL